MRAIVLLYGSGRYRYRCDLEVTNADDVWRQTEADETILGRHLREGDVVFLAGYYLAFGTDGIWRTIRPGPETEEFHRIVAAGVDRAHDDR